MLSYQANKEWLHKLMDLLEAHFGPDVEFVLHDLTLDYEHTIVDIRNGHITGREIGGTGDILGLEYIRNASEDNGTYYNFIEYTKEGKTLRKEISVSQWDGNNRGLYIGDYFYVVGSDQINVLDLNTLENVAQAIIPRG